MVDVKRLWLALKDKPGGTRLFGLAFGQAAPYFATIHLRVVSMEPNRAVVVVPFRRAVKNHIGTVHAIAACNGLEAAMGLCAEASIPPGRRWLPKGMQVSYLAKSTSELTCVATTDAAHWADGRADVPVRVRASRADGTVCVEGTIHLHVSDRP